MDRKAYELAMTTMGVSIGALIDIGKSDAEILEACQIIMSRFHAISASPEAMARLNVALRVVEGD